MEAEEETDRSPPTKRLHDARGAEMENKEGNTDGSENLGSNHGPSRINGAMIIDNKAHELHHDADSKMTGQ